MVAALIHDSLFLLGYVAILLLWRSAPQKLSKHRQLTHRSSQGQTLKRSIVVLIPARNEAIRLPRLLAKRQHPNDRMHYLVIDDHSYDQTAAVATAYGVDVLQAQDLPSGWYGKSWACYQGACATDEEWLIFLDADCLIEEQSLLDAVTWLAARRAIGYKEAVTVQPWHQVQSPPEQLSAFFNLVVWLGTVRNANKSYGGFGPCLIVHREDYQRVDGHRAIAVQLLEHHALCCRLAQHGVTVTQWLGDASFSFRMHEGTLQSVVQGWKKHISTGAKSTPRWRLLLIILLFCGAFSAFFITPLPFALLGYLSYALLFFLLFRQVGNFHPISAIAYPFWLLVFLLVFLVSQVSSTQKVVWKDRTYEQDQERR
nr:glycosyltransferase [Bacilli bacterium]